MPVTIMYMRPVTLFMLLLVLVAGLASNRPSLVLIAGLVLLVRSWIWLCSRFPLLGWFLIGMLDSLLNRGRRW